MAFLVEPAAFYSKLRQTTALSQPFFRPRNTDNPALSVGLTRELLLVSVKPSAGEMYTLS
jgi:hypothetical protein